MVRRIARLVYWLLVYGLFLVACRPPGDATTEIVTPEMTATSPADVETATSTAVPPPPTAIPQTPTPLPAPASPTPRPTEVAATPSLEPTAGMTSTITATASLTGSPSPTTTLTPSPVAVRIGEPCPAVAPLRPGYAANFLSPQSWPRPNAAASQSHFWLSRPLPGAGRMLINMSFPYGWDGGGRYLLHNGVDTAEKLGTPLLAAADGTVVVARADESELFGWRCDWYGELVVIELDQQWQGQPVYILYGHVLNIVVREGEHVSRGQQVAEIGVGGAAVVPHLHFEVRVGQNRFDSTRNPMLWIEPGESRGVIAGRLVDPEGRPWQGVTLTLIDTTGAQGLINSWSYLDDPLDLINPDEGLAENFVFADVRPGSYEVYTRLQDVEYRVPVTVLPGQVATVEVVTEAFKTPTPTTEAAEPPPPPSPESTAESPIETPVSTPEG